MLICMFHHKLLIDIFKSLIQYLTKYETPDVAAAPVSWH